MSDTAIARRYASALFQEAEAQQVTPQVDEALDMIGESLAGSRELVNFFASPVISRQKKERIVTVLFSERVPDLVLRMLTLLIAKGREALVPVIVQAYRTMRNERLNVVEAEARVAFALSQGDIDALEQALAKATGKQVRLKIKEDPSLVGGLMVRIGDTVYDSSVRRQLEVLRSQLEKGSFLSN